MACKDMEKCMETKKEIVNQTFNKNVECMMCDLASLESIKSFTNQIQKSKNYFLIKNLSKKKLFFKKMKNSYIF